MKKPRFFTLLLCFAAILVGPVPLNGQWHIGGIVGMNFASIKVEPGSSSEEYSGRAAFGIGVVVDRQLMEGLDLHLEPMYLQKGGKISTSNFNAKFKVNYFEIPAMLRYTLPLDLQFKPYAIAGPSLGLRSKAKYVYDDGDVQEADNEIRQFDLGAGVGAGVRIPKGTMTLFAEVRYMWGFINLNKESDESTVRNRGLQVYAGITIPLRKTTD